MSLREFRDRAGVEWRAWDITPERMHPATMREMFLGRHVDFQEGWIVFESATERRRLAPYPIHWADMSEDELEALLHVAKPTPKRTSESSGAFRRIEGLHAAAAESATAEGAESMESASAEHANEWREFRGASGRRWTVTLTATSRDADDGRRVLRFAADDGTVCDLAAWPDDWARYTTAQLVELLRGAELSRDASPGRVPRRRREDRQP